MADQERVRTEDVLPVMSRISWGAIFAGAFVALAVYALLSVLGLVLGLSVAGQASGETIAMGAGIWALVSLILALMAGGCVTTRCTAGENRAEAIMYGVILWGVMFAMTIWATGTVLRAGTGMLVGAANAVGAAAGQQVNWEQMAAEVNLSEAQVEQLRQKLPTAGEVRDMSTEAALWSLAGVIVSMAAAIGGALLGAGPTLAFRGVLVQQRTEQTTPSGGVPSR